MNDRIFIDTNLFVYAHVFDGGKKHEMAADLLRKRLLTSRVVVSTQVLNEFYSVMSKYQRTHDEISSFLTDIVRCANVVAVSLLTVELCLMLKGKYGYSYWDSLILAAAVENDCETVYSEDMSHGHVIEGQLIIQNPFISQQGR